MMIIEMLNILRCIYQENPRDFAVHTCLQNEMTQHSSSAPFYYTKIGSSLHSAIIIAEIDRQ